MNVLMTKDPKYLFLFSHSKIQVFVLPLFLFFLISVIFTMLSVGTVNFRRFQTLSLLIKYAII